jgi:DNA-binding PadR family transcriptional regulator
MDMVLLGLLKYHNLTVYEMKKALERVIALFYSGSYGTLHPATKRLESRGFIRGKRDSSGARIKNIFSITEKGRKELHNWLMREIPISRVQDEGLLKLFFLSELKREERIRLLSNYCTTLESHIHEIGNLIQEAQKSSPAEGMKERFRFQLLTADFGLKYYRFEKKWYEDVLKKMRAGEI